MKYLLAALLCFALASTSNIFAQSKTDEEAVSKLPREFCDAWAKHDGHALATIMAPDVDFVTVASLLAWQVRLRNIPCAAVERSLQRLHTHGS